MKNFFKRFHDVMTDKKSWKITSLISIPFTGLDMILANSNPTSVIEGYPIASFLFTFIVGFVFRTIFTQIIVSAIYATFKLDGKIN